MNQFQVISLADCEYAPWNYKEDNPDLLEKLKSNISKNGFIENLIVRPSPASPDKFEVINGNHRLQALSELGTETAMAYVFGPISDVDAKRIAVETNETRFGHNQQAFSNLLLELSEEFNPQDLEETMPWTSEEIDALINGDDNLPEPEEPELPSEREPTQHTCPRCGHMWE